MAGGIVRPPALPREARSQRPGREVLLGRRDCPQAWKLFPQPQEAEALGLLIRNPAPWNPSS